MTVQVRPLNMFGAGGGQPLNLWTDNFGQTPGRNIAAIRADYLFNSTTPSTDIAPSVGPVNLGLRFTSGATTNSTVCWCPISLGAAKGVEQFCEAILEVATGNPRCGWAVFATGDGRPADGGGNIQQYVLSTAGAPGALQIQSVVNNIVAVNIGAAFGVPAIGTKIALAVSFSGAANVFEVFYNEISQGTRTDAAPTLARAGLPGLFARNILNASVAEFGELRCGILSKLGY